MQRVFASGLVAAGLALLVPSCAQGNASTSGDVSSDVTGDTDSGAPSGGCGPCASGEKCSAGACVAVTTDADGDGVPLSLDCDDHDRDVHPGATEVCNGKDDNCDGKIDEGFDADGDGYPTCAALGKAADCDDKDATVHPGAAEVCNGKDDNCDGKIDESFDKDNDGFYACAHGTIAADCDDNDPLIHPGGTETCNAKDDDCNGKIDELPAALVGSLTVPVNVHWKTVGNALFSAAAPGWAQLTPDVGSQSGGLWWNAVYTFDTFDVTATFWIQAKPSGADGMAFTWVTGAAVPGQGYGAYYGAGGLTTATQTGYAVAIDTYSNPGDLPAPFLVIMDTAKPAMPLGTYPLPNVRDGANHTLRVAFAAGQVSVWIDGTNKVSNLPLPGTPIVGHWGFTGGTGGSSEAHCVKDVTMSFPNGQGCVP
ncbi:MAG TPA: MopE-related protein [Labilithrix sp.]|nr:MopE-related protein [Labilithrix sp.]